MDILQIGSNGYTNRKALWPKKDDDSFVMAMWQHCTAGFDNPYQIADTRSNRALLAQMFSAHNQLIEFVEPLKGKK